jgi:hypothetical protein
MLSEIVDRLTSMEIKLKDGSFYEVKENDLIAWSRTYKDCNVFYEVKAAAEWCEANPSRRKTLRGVKRFLNAWLSKAHKLKGSPLSFNQKEGHSNIEESLNDISWVPEHERKETSKWYLSSKGFYYLYGAKKVVSISDKRLKKQSKKP